MSPFVCLCQGRRVTAICSKRNSNCKLAAHGRAIDHSVPNYLSPFAFLPACRRIYLFLSEQLPCLRASTVSIPSTLRCVSIRFHKSQSSSLSVPGLTSPVRLDSHDWNIVVSHSPQVCLGACPTSRGPDRCAISAVSRVQNRTGRSWFHTEA